MSVLKENTKQTVYVAMSGGVDSSVAAALLKNKGFNIVGVFMKPWQPPKGGFCLWKEDREDAMRAAAVLDIPLLTWDFSKEYKKYVTDYMLKEYKTGRTPNPDVMCNKEIKFGLFFKKAITEGADYIATGHYIRIEPEFSISNSQFSKKTENLNIKNSLKIKNYKLKIAKDLNKDQTYFLWTLTQKQLAKTLFPIGDYIKPEVRKMAKKFGLPNHDKKDSQGVCFIGPLNMKNFLKNYIKPKKGSVLLLSGEKIGEHDGAFYYTIGQRHGLDIKNGQGPYFVIKKDNKKNIVWVGSEKDLLSDNAKLSQVSFINKNQKLPVNIEVKIRYRSNSEKAILGKDKILHFKRKIRAITPGQSAVFYRGAELLGGGIIE